MDTRTKILPASDAASLDPRRPLVLATGRFEILRLETVEELRRARERNSAKSLAVVIGPLDGELAPAAARAEMAAALRVVDYVFVAGEEAFHALVASLQPIEIIHLEEAEQRRTGQLIEHVQRLQSR